MSKRNVEQFPTKFGPATTRMPSLPNGKGTPTTGKFGVETVPGKRRSTWHEQAPERRGLKGPDRVDKNPKRTRARRKMARKTAHESRRVNR